MGEVWIDRQRSDLAGKRLAGRVAPVPLLSIDSFNPFIQGRSMGDHGAGKGRRVDQLAAGLDPPRLPYGEGDTLGFNKNPVNDPQISGE